MPFDKETCPYCADPHCEADFTDVGVGYVQTGPYHCYACGATEVGGFDTSTPSADELRIGWYAPNSPNLPDTISSLNGQFVDAETALAIYRRGVVDRVPFKLSVEPAEFARLMGFRIQHSRGHP
nr:hypothetical protein [uncultured bacterium]